MAVLAASYLTFLCLLPVRSIWISDEGNKLLTTISLARDLTSLLPDPATKLDASLSSYPPPFFVKGPDGYELSAYNPFFPALCAPLLKIAGLFGARLLPFFAGLLCALLASLIAKELGSDPRVRALAALAIGLCSPLAFYSFTLLEITLSSALWGLSALFAIKAIFDDATRPGDFRRQLRYLFLAGLFGGLSTILREEGYICLASFFLALLFCRVNLKVCFLFAVGSALTLLPLWLFNLHEAGSIFGLHAKIYATLGTGHSLSGRLLAIPANLYFFIAKPHFDSVFAALSTLLVLFTAFLAGLFGGRGFKLCGLALCLALTLANCLAEFFDPGLLASTIRFQSLLESLPLAFVPLLFLKDLFFKMGLRMRFLAISTFFSTLLVAALVDSANAGVFWGARHLLLPAVQLSLIAVCLLFFDSSRIFKILGLALMVVSLSIQLNGLWILWEKKAFSEALLEVRRCLQAH